MLDSEFIISTLQRVFALDSGSAVDFVAIGLISKKSVRRALYFLNLDFEIIRSPECNSLMEGNRSGKHRHVALR